MIDQDILKNLLCYNADTGDFSWEVSRGRAKKGAIAGNVKTNNSGHQYIIIRINNKGYYAHRLAFLYMIDRPLDENVDHIDGDSLNNKWDNLRAVDQLENTKNQKRAINNTSGCIGVSWIKIREKWYASISDNKSKKRLGSFSEYWEAVCARKSAEIKYGYHKNHGRV